MKRIAHLLIPAFVILLATTIQSCKKSHNDTEAVTPAPAPETPKYAVRGNYQPTTFGSIWDYKSTPNYRITMSKDTVIGGVTWTKATSTINSYLFYRKDNGNYYAKTRDSIGNDFTILYLKDTVPVSTTWNNDIVSGGFSTRYQCTVVGVNQTKTVGTTVYPNVIQVHRNIYVDYANNGIYSLYDSNDYFYAKDIGFISSQFKTTEANRESSILTFNIK